LDCLLCAYQWDAATLFENGRVRIGFQPRTKTSMWERDAVLALMDANPYFIRRCTGNSGKCKGLFYATRSTNTTCSRACISARYDGDPVKYEARLKTQRANHKSVKSQQDAAAKRALPAGHVIAKRARADHRATTDSESWLVGAGGLVAAGNLKSEDKKMVRTVGKAINQAVWQGRKTKHTFGPDVAFITRGELAKKSKR
jgi:phage protein D